MLYTKCLVRECKKYADFKVQFIGHPITVCNDHLDKVSDILRESENSITKIIDETLYKIRSLS